MKEDYKVDQELFTLINVKVTHDEMLGIEIICLQIGQSLNLKTDKRIENAKPVFIFAFFYICIIVMISSIK